MPARFSIATVEAVKQDLDTLPEIERELREVGLQDAIRALAPSIRKLRARGYKNARILELLKERGVEISGTTLKQYLGEKKSRNITKREAKGHDSAEPAGGSGGEASAITSQAAASPVVRAAANARSRAER
jgi:hypothetical protein